MSLPDNIDPNTGKRIKPPKRAGLTPSRPHKPPRAERLTLLQRISDKDVPVNEPDGSKTVTSFRLDLTDDAIQSLDDVISRAGLFIQYDNWEKAYISGKEHPDATDTAIDAGQNDVLWALQNLGELVDRGNDLLDGYVIHEIQIGPAYIGLFSSDSVKILDPNDALTRLWLDEHDPLTWVANPPQFNDRSRVPVVVLKDDIIDTGALIKNVAPLLLAGAAVVALPELLPAEVAGFLPAGIAAEKLLPATIGTGLVGTEIIEIPQIAGLLAAPPSVELLLEAPPSGSTSFGLNAAADETTTVAYQDFQVKENNTVKGVHRRIYLNPAALPPSTSTPELPPNPDCCGGPGDGGGGLIGGIQPPGTITLIPIYPTNPPSGQQPNPTNPQRPPRGGDIDASWDCEAVIGPDSGLDYTVVGYGAKYYRHDFDPIGVKIHDILNAHLTGDYSLGPCDTVKTLKMVTLAEMTETILGAPLFAVFARPTIWKRKQNGASREKWFTFQIDRWTPEPPVLIQDIYDSQRIVTVDADGYGDWLFEVGYVEIHQAPLATYQPFTLLLCGANIKLMHRNDTLTHYNGVRLSPSATDLPSDNDDFYLSLYSTFTALWPVKFTPTQTSPIAIKWKCEPTVANIAYCNLTIQIDGLAPSQTWQIANRAYSPIDPPQTVTNGAGSGVFTIQFQSNYWIDTNFDSITSQGGSVTIIACEMWDTIDRG